MYELIFKPMNVNNINYIEHRIWKWKYENTNWIMGKSVRIFVNCDTFFC